MSEFCNHAFLNADGTIRCNWNNQLCVKFKIVEDKIQACGGYEFVEWK